MRKTSKFTWLLLLLSIFILGLVSCTNPDETGGTNEPVEIDEEVIFSPQINTAIVLGEGLEADDVITIRNAYFKIVGKEVSIKTADEEPSDHEIIIGKTDRDISEKAYRSIVLNNNDEEKVGYSIYSDGKSVAIAFDEASFGENVAFAEAIDYFVEKYMTKSSLKLNAGIAHIENFYPIEKQKERDEDTLNRLWELKYSQILAKLENVYKSEERANDILNELQSLNSLYNQNYKTVTWLANLYDPDTGGFYYSNSARNNEGFAPDLGSTSEALYLTELILGGYGGTLTDYFGKEIADKFVSFAKSMQDSNGYFYHPQWSRELTDKTPDRKNIDVTNALSILEAFGASPTYDTPNGVKGDGIVSAVSNLTAPLKIGKVLAVSKVTAGASNEIYIPSYLMSEEAFSNYLSSLDIKNNVSDVCQTISSELPLYFAVDEMLEEKGESYRLCDILKSFLDKNRNYTGLWSSSSKASYKDIGEVAYVIKIYNAIGASIPNYNVTLNTILSAMQFKTEPNNISDIAAVWIALDYAVNNVRTHGNEFLAEQVNENIKNIYIEFNNLLKLTADKLLLYVNEDGSFSSTTDGSESLLYGMSVAIPLTEEGDIKATLLAAKDIWLSVFSVLGIGDVPIFNTSDRMMFQKTLLDMGVIVKNEIIKTTPEDFESYEINSTPLTNQVVSTDSYSSIVEGADEHGKVLHLYSAVVNSTDEFYIKPSNNVRSASCYSYDFDMRVLPEQSTGAFSYIFLFRYMHLISLERVGDEIRFIERTNAWEDTGYYTDLGVRVNVGDWFNLRVEYYFGTRETVRIKIFINGKCVAVTDNFNGKQSATSSPSSTFEGIAIMSLRNKGMSLQLDNVVCESSYATYTAETTKDLIVNVDTPDKKQNIYTFDNAVVGSTPTEFKPGGEASAVTVKTDSDGNNVLAVSEKAGEIILPIDQRGIGVNSAVVEFDFIVDYNSDVGAKYQISFNEYLYQERMLGALRLSVANDGDQKYITISEVTAAGKEGTTYSNVKLSLGVKYNLKLQIFYKEKAIIVSVDGEIVGINANVLANAEKYNMREITITALTQNKASEILIDNLVSEKITDDYIRATTPEKPRNEYTFDDTEGMEISGIEPTDGVLSFENLTGNTASVKIPVNKRVITPTLSVINLDVAKTASTHGEVLLKLTDKNGNIVAAFAIERNAENLNVHEYTENGRYPTPIYTTNAETFTITLRYSEEMCGYNLFVDGAYITSSSLIYNETSGEYKFEYLQITSEISSGLSIDNLYAEKVSDFLITSADASTNSDNKSEVLTFESSSFASLPNKIVTYFNSEGTYLNIKEQKISGKVNKVLEFYADAKDNLFCIERTETVADTNAAFFETWVMIKSEGGKMGASFSPQAYIDNTYPYLVDFRLTVEDIGAPVVLSSGDINEELSVTEGEWFKVRFEYTATPYDYDYDGKIDAFLRVYVNDNLVAEGHKLRDANVVLAAKSIYRTKIVALNPGTIFLNDTKGGQFNTTYEEPVPIDEEVLEFNPPRVTYQTAFTFGKNTSTAKISEMPTVADAANKVLDFYTAKDSADKMSVVVTKENPMANAVMFETEIMIDPETDVATFWLSPQNNKSKYPFRLKIEAIKGGAVTISSAENGISETVIGNSGEWIKLKVEYMNPMLDYTGDGLFDILCKIYVGDSETPEVIGYKPYNSSSYYNPLDLIMYVFEAPADTEANVLFDNMKFWQVELIPDEPVNEGAPDSGSMGGTEDNTLDNDGWV